MPLVRIRFHCPNAECGVLVDEYISVAYPDFSAERMSDGDAIESHDLMCPVCDTSYSLETVSSFGGVTARLDDGTEVDADIEHEPDLDDYLRHYIPPADALDQYRESRDQLLALLEKQPIGGEAVLHRMIFSQLIAVMEAYLSDKLLRLVIDEPVIKERVASKADLFRDYKIPLKDVVLDPTLGESIFRLTLQKVLYHDLEKVDKLYRIALEGPFFPRDNVVKETLEAAVKKRHDCVHRNGRDMDGRLHIIDDVAIRKVCAAIDALVDQVEVSAQREIPF